MIDMLVLQIPFQSEHFLWYDDYKGAELHDSTIKALSNAGFKMQAHSVDFELTQDENGNKSYDMDVRDITSPWESLPSSFSTLAIKVHKGGKNYLPHIEVKASPAKLLQGHNVFGFEDFRLAASAVLEPFVLAYRPIFKMLCFKNIEIKSIDVTYSARFENSTIAARVLDFLRSVNTGQNKLTKDKGTTLYWNKADSKNGKQGSLIQLKAYLKDIEIDYQLKELKRKNKKLKDGCYQHEIEQLENPKIKEFARGLVRFEATIKKEKLKRLNIPHTLLNFLDYADDKKLCRELWQNAFKNLLQALEGQAVDISNDENVFQMLKRKLHTVTKNGDIRYTQANNAFDFYLAIKTNGYNSVKEIKDKQSFNRRVKLLMQAGFSKAQLQNLQQTEKNNVMPFVKSVAISFDSQRPADYVTPKTLTELIDSNVIEMPLAKVDRIAS